MRANTVKGFFGTLARAEHVKSKIAILKKIPAIDMHVYNQAGFQPSSGSLCPEGIRRGGPVLEVQADEGQINTIANLLEQSGAEDISVLTAAEW